MVMNVHFGIRLASIQNRAITTRWMQNHGPVKPGLSFLIHNEAMIMSILLGIVKIEV